MEKAAVKPFNTGLWKKKPGSSWQKSEY